ncbi:MAG: phosphatidylserine decarboxylase family protein [Bacteroidales bacterium]|nr:phosphatidylserine decarboxylase family protein [Bacteroidales bacterium]MBN2758476.1 phosphatidylserine decarboxylase family protein [Bacteroidales bacterium]
MIYLFLESLLISTVLFLYLNYKAKVELKYLLIDNLIVAAFATVISALFNFSYLHNLNYTYILNIVTVPTVLVIGVLIRFYRVPYRKTKATADDIVSPADGNVIYIKRIEAKDIPIAIKNGEISKLEELTNTDILDTPCWLIGINMTPFDVHKNSAPISGKITLNKHFDGKYLSLKEAKSEVENERNTIVIDNGKIKVGVVQIASKKVRRVVTYFKEGQSIDRGDWFGMIKFGSQVDVIIPVNYQIELNLKDQVYAGRTIIATPIN